MTYHRRKGELCPTLGEREKFNLVGYLSLIIGGIRAAIAVGTSYAVIIWSPTHARVFPPTAFIVPVVAFASVGTNIGDTLLMSVVTLFAVVIALVEATIAIAICANIWVIPACVFVIVAVNLYIFSFPFKTLLSATAVVMTVTIASTRASTHEVGPALRTMWDMMIGFLVAFAMAIGAVFAIPSCITLSIKEECSILMKKTKKLLRQTCDVCQPISKGDRAAILAQLHILKLFVNDCNENVAWLEKRAVSATRELIFCFPFTSIALQARARINLTKALLLHCEEVLATSRNIIAKDNLRCDKNLQHFYAVLSDSLTVLMKLCDKVITNPDELSATPKEIEDLYNEYLDSVKHARVKQRDNLREFNNSRKIHTVVGHMAGTQLQFYHIAAILSKFTAPVPSKMDCFKASIQALKIPPFAQKADLLSFRRIFDSIKYGVMAGIGQMFTFLFPEVFEYGNASKTFYVAMTVALVATVDFTGSAFLRIFSRIIGTGIGVMFTLVIFVLVPTPIINNSYYPAFFISAWSGLCFIQMRRAGHYSYAVFVAAITPMLVSMEGIAFFPTKEEEIATLVTRLFGTAVGAGLCFIASCIWLNRATRCMDKALAALFMTMGKAFESVTTTSQVAAVQGLFAKVTFLLGECQVEPAFWGVPFQESHFLAMHKILKHNIRLMSLIDGAVEIGGLRDEDSPMRELILKIRVVNGPTNQIMQKLSSFFSDGASLDKDLSMVSWDSLMDAFTSRFEDLAKIIEKYFEEGSEMLQEVGHHLDKDASELPDTLVGDSKNGTIDERDKVMREYLARHHKEHTKTFMALNAISYYLFEYHDNVRTLISAVDDYAFVAGISNDYDGMNESRFRSIAANVNLLFSS